MIWYKFKSKLPEVGEIITVKGKQGKLEVLGCDMKDQYIRLRFSLKGSRTTQYFDFADEWKCV